MDHTARVTELVLRWEELRDHGRPMTAEELCRACPELLQEVKHRLAALASVDQKLASGPAERSPQRLPMKPAKAAGHAADRNLLFGVLALQMDFITKDALLAAMHAWMMAKDRPLGGILLEQGALDAEHHELLSALVQAHLKKHGNDPEKSLATVSSLGSVRQDLEKIADADLGMSLGQVSRACKDDDPYATVTHSVGESTSSGTRFRILRPHARGGLGQVYVAHDEELHREVALKEIQERHADHPESRARFMLEAEITGGLEHPGIVPVYGLGQYADGRPFYAMRFIRGDSLKDAIDRVHKKRSTDSTDDADKQGSGTESVKSAKSVDDFGGLEFRQLLGRFIDVCNAIAYGHSRGVLHRDLKPGNIMLGKYRETLVVDWGLAKAVERSGEPGALATGVEPTLRPSSASGSAETQAGSAIGTPQFMSPEQAAGRLDLLGPASDVYSLGATLYCLLTGKPPFEGKDIGVLLQQVQRGEFARPRQVKADVPAPLEAVCLKAMALEPKDRYSSPRALADDIEHWLADEPVSAWPEPWTVKGRRWMARHRVLVTGAAVALAVGVASLLIATGLLATTNQHLEVARENADREAQRAKEARIAAEGQKKQADAARGEAAHQKRQRKGNCSGLNGCFTSTTSRWPNVNGKMATFAEPMTRSMPAGQVFVAGNIAIFGRYSTRIRRPCVDTQGASRASACWSVDGKRIASASEGNSVRIWDAETGKELRRLRGHQSVAFSPGGKEILTGSPDYALKFWNVETGQEIRRLDVLARPDFADFSACFSPDGRRIVAWIVGGGSVANTNRWHEVTILDGLTGQRIATLTGHTGRIASASFSPDSKRVVSAGWDNTIRLWDSVTGKNTLTIRNEFPAQSVSISPDGKRIAGAMGNTVQLWDAMTGDKTLRCEHGLEVVTTVSFSPDGKNVVSGGSDSMLKLWDATTGKEILTLKGHTDPVRTVCFCSDNKRIASAGDDTTLKIWEVSRRTGNPVLTGDMRKPVALSLSSKSERIVVADWDVLKVWDARSFKQLLALQGHRYEVASVAFSPDGREIVSGGIDQIVRVWNSSTGRISHTLKGHRDTVRSVSFSVDGKLIVSASQDKTLSVWDAEKRTERMTLRGHTAGVWAAAFSPDGKRIASGSEDRTLKIWDLVSGETRLTLEGHTGEVMTLAYSPDGKWIASASLDNTVKVWNSLNGRDALTLKGHSQPIWAVAFSPDGKRIVSGSHDKTVKVWDAKSGQDILTLKGHRAPVSGAVFGLDGVQLITASIDGTLRIWDAHLTKPTNFAPYTRDTLLAMWERAKTLTKFGRSGDAIVIVDECLRRATDEIVNPGLIEGLFDIRLRHFEKAKDAAGCRATAEMWEELTRTDSASLYDAACFRAVTAAVTRASGKSADAKQADAEADRAMSWLRQAVAAGYNNVAHMKQDKDLDSLRGREDFKKLVAELEAGKAKGKRQ